MFIGYSSESKGYKLFDPLTGKLQVSREVVFYEEKIWNWSNSIGPPLISSTLNEALDQCNEDTAVRENQTFSQNHTVQQNSLSPAKASPENSNPRYRMIYEIYNSCSFAVEARDPNSFEEANQ